MFTVQKSVIEQVLVYICDLKRSRRWIMRTSIMKWGLEFSNEISIWNPWNKQWDYEVFLLIRPIRNVCYLYILLLSLSFLAQDDETVVMTGGSFTAEEKTVTTQPKVSRSNSSKIQGRQLAAQAVFDDTLSERDWKTGLCSCESGNSSRK